MLEGASEVLKRHKPAIFLEAHSQALERSCREALSELDYSVRLIGPEPSDAEHTRHLIALPR